MTMTMILLTRYAIDFSIDYENDHKNEIQYPDPFKSYRYMKLILSYEIVPIVVLAIVIGKWTIHFNFESTLRIKYRIVNNFLCQINYGLLFLHQPKD